MHVYGEISGRLSTEGQLSGRLAAEGQLAGELTIPAQILPPAYAGAYTFTPTEETQTAATADLMLTDDITIEPIPEEYIIPAGSTNINQNGPHDVTEYAEAIVDVQPALQAKAITIDSAGTETVTPGSGYYGLSEVEVTVPGGQILRMTGLTTYPEISISDNGLVRAFVNDALTVFPVSEAGWLEAEQDGTTVYIAVDEYKQLPVQAGATVTPSESQQVAVPKGKWTTGAVNVGAIPSNYIGSGIYRADADDVVFYENDLEVVVTDGYYDEVVVKTIPSGTAGTPSASKGAVSNHAVLITPSVTNTTGYITGDTKTGMPVSVSAAELVSGTYTVDSSGTKDVTNYAAISVPSAEVDLNSQNGFITDSGNRKWRYRPFAETDGNNGWYAGGVGNWVTYNAVAANTTITPTESAQTIGGANYMMEAAVTIAAIPSNYVGSGITRRDSTDLSASGATVSVPSGYYENSASKAVASGTVTAPASITGTSATVSTGTNTLTLSKTVSVTPSVTTAGYVTSGTAGNSSVSLTASVTTQAAQTIYPSASDQTITGSKYLTGTQTIKGVTTTNLTADNIKSGVTVQIGDSADSDRVASVTGTYSGGTSKNVQVVQGTTRTNASTLTAIGSALTVSKTGTYDVYWSGFRSNTSSSYTWATQLYVGGSAYGSENTTWTNNVQNNHLSNVSLTANQQIRVYGRNTRGTSYYIYAPTLVIVEA